MEALSPGKRRLTCAVCGAVFIRYAANVRQSVGGVYYCSTKCAAEGRRRPPSRVCAYCGGPFGDVAHPEKTYCSRPCFVAGIRARARIRFAERFWAKVDKSGDCWLWTGSLDHKGYGSVYSPFAGRAIVASRAAWQLVNGRIPGGLEVCHDCPGGDNPRCVNPAHLYLGTHRQNMDDMVAKGRTASGERHHSRRPGYRHPRTIRSPELDGVIQNAYAAGGVTQKALAARFGVSEPFIYQAIRRGRSHQE